MDALFIKFKFVDNGRGMVHVEDMDDSIETERLRASILLTFDRVKELSSLNLTHGPNATGYGNRVILPMSLAQNMRHQLLTEIGQFPEDVLSLTVDPELSKAILRSEPLSPTRVLGALAVSGIETCLPTIPDMPFEELIELRTRREPERQAFLDGLRAHISDARKRILGGDYVDAWEYAKWETSPKLLTNVNCYERTLLEAASSHGRKFGSLVKSKVPEWTAAIVGAIPNPIVDGPKVLLTIFSDISAAKVQSKLTALPPPDDQLAFIVQLRNQARDTCLRPQVVTNTPIESKSRD